MSNMNQVTLKEAARLIATTGSAVTYLLQGEPGVGKSAILATLAASLPTHHPVYLEAQTLDLGDVQMPVVDKDTGVHFVPNSAFLPPDPKQPDQPLIIMLDEIGKAMRPVQNALLRLMHERKLGDYSLPTDSIVFATTNLASDGVGDMIQSHAKNRVTDVTIKKPDAEEWAIWASANDVDPAVTAWVREYPHCLASYTDPSQQDNPFIYNPKKQQAAFVSPRSLEKASSITKHRTSLTPNALRAALAGTIGESAAAQMEAYLTQADALPAWARVIDTPKDCPVPTEATAQSIMALQAVQRITRETASAWFEYMARLHTEVQALFVSQAMEGEKAQLLVTNRSFVQWAVTNSWAY